MRTASLIPLACVATLVVACRSDVPAVSEQETAARAAEPRQRDLTLQVPELPATEVASAVELARPQASRAPRSPRPRPRPKPAPRPTAEPAPGAAGAPATAPVMPAAPMKAEALADPAPVDDAASSGRELAPGKTVTVIPVSSGPSIRADEDDSWLPSERPRGIIMGGGGRCPRRGGVRGIGIAGRIPVGIPTRRLR